MTQDHTRLPPQTPGYHTPDTGAVLKTIANPHPAIKTRQKHILAIPELCPASRNPGAGSMLEIDYRGRQHFLEVFSLSAYLRAFIGHPRVRDVELLTQTIARDCAAALGHKVRVTGRFELPGIEHCVVTQATARPDSRPAHTTTL